MAAHLSGTRLFEYLHSYMYLRDVLINDKTVYVIRPLFMNYIRGINKIIGKKVSLLLAPLNVTRYFKNI